MTDTHPYAKFIHPENQDILWSLFLKIRPTVNTDQSFFKAAIKEYYTEHLLTSQLPCKTVRELFEINRAALTFLVTSFNAKPQQQQQFESHDIFARGGINVVEERQRLEEEQSRKFADYSAQYHQLLAKPLPKNIGIMNADANVLAEEKIRNMDELLEQQVRARKEDEMRIAALIKSPEKTESKVATLTYDPNSAHNLKPPPLKIHSHSLEKAVSWDPVIEIVDI